MESDRIEYLDRCVRELTDITAVLRRTLAAAAVVCLLAGVGTTWLTYWDSNYASGARIIVTTRIGDLLIGYGNNTRGTVLREVVRVGPAMIIASWVTLLTPVGLLAIGATGRFRRALPWLVTAGSIGVIGCVFGIGSIGFGHVPWTYHPQIGPGLAFLAVALVLAAGFAYSGEAADELAYGWSPGG